MTTIHANAVSASTKRNVAADGRKAGYAGAVIGTKKNSGEAMIVGDCVMNANAALVAARTTSAGPGNGVPRDAMKRSTASAAMMMLYTAMKNPKNGFTN